MFLQKLDVHGFKSFLDRTEIRFGPGITCIVGPNGCGKTNLTDAIRWVLGEQSAKQLRGETMEDVIFGGSVKRKPVGMAEVSLLLSNARGTLPTEYSEVQIGRRVYRSGASEYFLNKTPVRLRDVRELFYGTGMGSHAYSVIERAMVDHVLSDASGHRRFLFEEASGITKYKQRKREALSKLEATETDVLRVQDIIFELDRELGSLSRQVARTRRAERLRSGIRDLDLRLSCEKHQERFARERHLAEQQQEEAVRREASAAELARREAEAVTQKTALLDLERELSEARQALADAETERARAEHEAAVLGERAEGLGRQLGELGEDRTRLETRLADLAAREHELRAQLAALAEEVAHAAAESARQERVVAELEDTIKARREVATQNKQLTLGLLQDEAGRRAECEGARARLSALAERRRAAEEHLAALAERLRALEVDEAAARSEEAALAAEAQAVAARVGETQAALAAAEEQLAAAGQEEADRREALTGARVRIEALEDIKSQMEGLEEGVKALLAEGSRLGVRGVVADLLVVEPGYLDAVEALLGPVLGAAVVDSEADAERALELVGGRPTGRASVAVLERGRGPQSLRSPHPGEAGVVGWVREGVRALDSHDGLIEVVLGDAVLVEAAADAERLSKAYPGVAFVSRGGVVWEGGMAAGGRPTDADRGLLRREHELRELRGERERLEAVFAATGEEKLRVLRQRDETARSLAAAEERAGQLAQGLRAVEARLQGLARELGAVREEHGARSAETSGLAAQEQASGEAVQALEAELAKQSAESSTASERLAGLEIELESLERQREEQLARAQQARQAWFEVNARHSAATADLARVETEHAELSEGLRARAREIEQAGERRGQALTEREGLAETLAVQREREATRRRRAEVAAARTREARERLETEDYALGELRREQMELAELVHHLEVEKLTVRGELEKTLERLRVEYEVDLEKLELPPLPEGETWDPAAAEARLESLRGRYRELGPVNLLALEEFTKKKERHTFLTSQRDDLMQAKAQLLEAIEKINSTASQLFRDTFAEVQQHFKETFGTLFEGGDCGLSMVGDDPLECEIEIVARPRGKNLQSILLLSGGERALTAIALLFAIYLVKPSPFCILDEVDAPLDDANIERFVNMLRRFSDRTQFIVVTHNKKTMEVAESIYGVTMQEPGVSKIVSVRFESRHDGDGEPAAEATDEARAPEAGIGPAAADAAAATAAVSVITGRGGQTPLAEPEPVRAPVRVRRAGKPALPVAAPAPGSPPEVPAAAPETASGNGGSETAAVAPSPPGAGSGEEE